MTVSPPRRKHAAARLRTYVDTHDNVIDQLLRVGFLLSDDLEFRSGEGCVLLVGRLTCVGGVYVDVRKRIALLDDDDDPLVQTEDYSYNVAMQGIGNLFRYDGPHRDHNKDHHVHRYDPLAGDHEGRTEFLFAEEDRPTLGEVVSEAEEWFFAHLDELQNRGLVPLEHA